MWLVNLYTLMKSICYASNGTWTFPQNSKQPPAMQIKLSAADLCCFLFFSIPFLDINECDEDPHICHRIEKNSDCRNRRPGFECLCKSGFQPFYNDSVTPRVLVNCTGKNLLFLWKVELRRGLEGGWGGGGWGGEGKRRHRILLSEKHRLENMDSNSA